jgi:hypothetical protein
MEVEEVAQTGSTAVVEAGDKVEEEVSSRLDG